MLRRMLLLAGMALAVVVLAAPAAAMAEANWVNPGGGTVGGEGAGSAIELEGEISSTIGTLETTATIRLEGEAFNESMGEGAVFGEAVGAGRVQGIPFPFCSVEVTLLNQPWTATLTNDTKVGAGTNNATLDLEGFRILLHYGEGCQIASGGKIPPTVGATGTVTATLANNGNNTDATLEGGDLVLYNPPTGAHVPGPVPYNLSSNPNPLTIPNINVEQH